MSFDSRDQDTGNSITLTRSEYQRARFKGKIFSLFMFNALLVFLTIVGIYHSFTGGKQKTTDEYLRGGQTIAIWPAILSLSVSFMSSVSMLGLPAEIYTFGAIAYVILGSGKKQSWADGQRTKNVKHLQTYIQND